MYLCSCVSNGVGVSDEISLHIIKTRSGYTKLHHLWLCCDVDLTVKGRVYNALVNTVPLCACKTWSL